ncbi:MAG: hypothetical protein CVT63_02660 [Candidatus Anoxymicrobium japonicum]|uniref:Uncharacterized protein n=1 Tax=Candidatus Anoxymicrobium japonicum TaxID=2013648 RepID=A0A2N3G766_9ACTN|nr:MAG: hypothetical protein CVT63_02660 [Candidatus Anoxymicrobium japonicum]
MVLATKNDLEKIKPKIASAWVKDWMSELGRPVGDREEFRVLFERFLSEELGFAEVVAVSIDSNELDIKIENCVICPGNDLLRAQGAPTLCPILLTGLMAINRVLRMRPTLLGVDKRGTGFCTIKYAIAPGSSAP